LYFDDDVVLRDQRNQPESKIKKEIAGPHTRSSVVLGGCARLGRVWARWACAECVVIISTLKNTRLPPRHVRWTLCDAM